MLLTGTTNEMNDVANVGKVDGQQRGINDRSLQTSSNDSRRYAERSRVRRLPEDRGALGSPATMQNVRSRRLLR
jgi:hypothetical protein